MRTFPALLLCLAVTTACKKKDSGSATGSAAAKPASGDQTAKAPAAPAAVKPTKLAQVGVTVDLPAGAQIDEQKMDAGGVQATISYGDMPNFFIENVNDMSDNADAVEKHSEAKDWKLQTKNPDGTFTLEWTKPDMVDATKLTFNVATRTKVGDKQIDCGSNGLTEAQASELLKVCASIKP